MGLLRASVAALVAAVLPGCTQMFYFPSRAALGGVPENAEDVTFRSADGTRLHGWLLHSTEGAPRARFVHFHGNAGNITSHVRQLAWVTRRGYDLLEFDYRGYGRSDGMPTPDGVHQDAVTVLSWAEETAARDQAPLVLYGQSLGGAVMLRAIGDVGTRRVLAVVAEGTFHSYEEEAASVFWRTPLLFPFTGFAYALVSDRYSPAPYVASIAPVPLLVIHGDQDRVVDVAFGRAVYDLGRPPKSLWIVRGGRHTDALAVGGGVYRDELLAFVEASRPAFLERERHAE